MSLHTEALEGGFANPVLGAQATFRALMDAMSRPGTIHTIGGDANPPHPVGVAQGAVALTLADHDTTVWLSPALAHETVKGWVGFHTGAEIVASSAHARFAFLAAGEPIPDFHGFAPGSQDYPDRSATLVIELPALSGGPEFVARGPGIKDSTVITAQGLPADFLRRWATNRAFFPLGLDIVFTAGSDLMALPRSTDLQALGG
ncbi:alpha-D-ribose 1-methylphosphonate 5-triphosphate synthase subunit PhnH [Rhizobium aquaticum]|uniref:Alpha-D-ribose 1-methylphosphonate 5-triphosphate synthase subunit PhnH n=1 Tax=Rhizobium aquaticum TaxID=1549636 RepID=A0ABV2J2D3_9HYPH